MFLLTSQDHGIEFTVLTYWRHPPSRSRSPPRRIALLGRGVSRCNQYPCDSHHIPRLQPHLVSHNQRWEATMRSSFSQLIIGIAVAAVGVGMISGAFGQSAAEEVVLTNRHEFLSLRNRLPTWRPAAAP